MSYRYKLGAMSTLGHNAQDFDAPVHLVSPDADTNKRISSVLNEASHVYSWHAEGKWKTEYKDRFASLLIPDLKTQPKLIANILNLENRVFSMVVYRAVELLKMDIAVFKEQAMSYKYKLDTSKMNSLIDEAVAELVKAGANFQPITNAKWVPAIEEKFTRRFPPLFRNLVTRYSFPMIELEAAELFSNFGDASQYDLTAAPFCDLRMSPWLIQHGFIYIGHPYIGDHDPVCFDMNGIKMNQEPKVVTLNHEDILLQRQQIAITPLADSFATLLGGQQRV